MKNIDKKIDWFIWHINKISNKSEKIKVFDWGYEINTIIQFSLFFWCINKYLMLINKDNKELHESLNKCFSIYKEKFIIRKNANRQKQLETWLYNNSDLNKKDKIYETVNEISLYYDINEDQKEQIVNLFILELPNIIKYFST